MTELLFSLERFLSLSGPELRNYVEPFVNTKPDAIPETVYEPLQSKLANLDEEHLVYALEICMLLKPSKFVRVVMQFLSHNDAAVCSTAFRVIERLPLTDEIIEQIAATPITEVFTSHVRTGERIRIGTNEQFIRSLFSKKR